MAEPAQYDIFLSYAHADVIFASDLAREIQELYRVVAKRDIRIFFDQREILTSADWRQKIHSGLFNSTILVAVLSQDYFTSQWCGREWDYFVHREREMQPAKLVYPVWANRQVDAKITSMQAQRRIRDAAARQYVDLSDAPAGTDEHRVILSKLAGDVHAGLEAASNFDGDDSGLAAVRESLTSVEQPFVTSHYGGTASRFVELLAHAVNVTIVGITNENLARLLERALRRKRSREGERSFWQSISVIFLSDQLLPYVNDELSAQLPSAREALLRRSGNSALGRHSVASFFLRANFPNRWHVYDYAYLMPFTGAMFDMPDGSTIINIGFHRPRTSWSDQLFWEFEERVDRYFTDVFREIIINGTEQNELILTGSPADDLDSFYCRGVKIRRSAMIDDANAADWLPAVIVVTWRQGGGNAVPLLQVNTLANSTREIGKVSHISGYVNFNDLSAVSQGGDSGAATLESLLTLPCARNAVRRELLEEVRLPVTEEPQLYATLPFYYPDKENLFFYLFELCVPSNFVFPPAAEMRSWTVDELMRIREHQVALKVQELVSRSMEPQQRSFAVDIATQNLILHGHSELAGNLQEWHEANGGGATSMRSTLDDLVRSTQVGKYSAGRQLKLTGLAGLQYREFFSAILPLYAQIGVPGAAELIHRLRECNGTSSAIDRLAAMYHDEGIMMSLPIEM